MWFCRTTEKNKSDMQIEVERRDKRKRLTSFRSLVLVYFVFFFEMELPYISQTGLKHLGSRNPPTSAS
jgi:hypothetical protein